MRHSEGAGHAVLGNTQISHGPLGGGLLVFCRCNEIIMPTGDIISCGNILR
jgi:hypothetical protein